MATSDAGAVARVGRESITTKRLKTFLGRYFYLCMALAMAALVVWGFSRTVDTNLFHASPPRPWLLWVHGTAFSTWMAFFIAQSSLVRAQKVGVHRVLGWFGAGLATLMVALGFTIAVIMARFNGGVLHQTGVDAFLSIPFGDMIIFGPVVAAAIYWRKRPEYHRRLIFMASCQLMDAAIGRFDFFFDHNLFYPALDFLIALGMARDWFVDGRVNKIYFYALAPMIAVQSLAVYAWRINPGWWQAFTHAILGQ
jgi:hypothetical protein